MEPDNRIISFPIHLGIIFIGDFENNLFGIIKQNLMKAFGPFFYNLINLGRKDTLEYFPGDYLKRGIKKELKQSDSSIETLNLHPTKKFHQLLIEKKLENGVDAVLSFTDLPLYSSYDKKILFLFGETNFKHQLSLISSFNLKEEFYNRHKDDKLFERRLIKEAIHEVGHLILGAKHCSNQFCVMKYSNEISDIDKKSSHLCKSCYERLLAQRKRYNL
jgi:predicted Zn-dependent protease